MVSLAIIVDEDGHISRHLSSLKVSHPEHTALYLLAPFRSPPALQFREEKLMLEVGSIWLADATG